MPDKPFTLSDWFTTWAHMLPAQAVADLTAALDPTAVTVPERSDGSESRVQSECRLIASSEFHAPLWRNNNGAMTTDDGRHVRFGLGNDSAALNKKWKSSDLIGVLPVRVTADHVGQMIGQFVAAEIKQPNWRMRPSDSLAQAQAAFGKSVIAFGGRAGFVQSTDDLRRLLS